MTNAPRTSHEAPDLDAALSWLDTLDPDVTPAHVVPLQVNAVARAADAVEAAERALLEAVVWARREGVSWNDLARPLGVSRQAVRQKYNKYVDRETAEHREVEPIVVDFRDVDERDRHDVRS